MKRSVLLLLIFLSLSAYSQKNKNIEGTFVHAVYFWLNEPDDQQQRNAFLESLNKFIDNSRYIASRHIGVPADTNRAIIDNSYTFSLIVSFENKEMHDRYQEEAIHKQFIKESEHLWRKVQIFDSVIVSE